MNNIFNNLIIFIIKDDEEISNTITQFAALLNSRTSNKSQSGFPHTPSNISSYSKLDAIFAPRSIHTPSVMSRVSDSSLNKTNNETKSINSQCDKSQTDINSTNNNLTNDKSSYSSLKYQQSSSNEKIDIINVGEKQNSSLSFSNNDLKYQKPRSIKFVQYPSKRSLSISEGTTNIDVISKSNQDDKYNLTNNIVLNKSLSIRNRSNSTTNQNFSSNESLNRRKIPEANNSTEQKTIYSSSYSTLESNNNNRLKVDEESKHTLKIPSKSSLNINIDNSNESLSINIPSPTTDVEKMIPPESPLFIRRRCSQSSSKSNNISRSHSTLSSSKPKFNIGKFILYKYIYLLN